MSTFGGVVLLAKVHLGVLVFVRDAKLTLAGGYVWTVTPDSGFLAGSANLVGVPTHDAPTFYKSCMPKQKNQEPSAQTFFIGSQQ